jgi:hypothetical protein
LNTWLLLGVAAAAVQRLVIMVLAVVEQAAS